jgi:hypothetical protein
VLAEKPTTAPSRVGAAPSTVNATAGAPSNDAVTGRAVSEYSWLQPSRSWAAIRSRSPTSIDAPSCVPKMVRSELVVCCATPRLSDCAPVSVKAAAVSKGAGVVVAGDRAGAAHAAAS